MQSSNYVYSGTYICTYVYIRTKVGLELEVVRDDDRGVLNLASVGVERIAAVVLDDAIPA